MQPRLRYENDIQIAKIDNLPDYEELERQLKINNKLKESYKAVLERIGGPDYKAFIKGCMKRSLTTSVMSHMNMEGKKGNKIGFKDTALYNIIRDLTIALFRVTEMQVKTCVRDYLKYAPYRTDGHRRG